VTAVNTARRTATGAANSGVLVGPTRMGFIGYGLLHLAVGWLAVQIALGNAADSGDQSGRCEPWPPNRSGGSCCG
jgi:hypothetical protein